MTTHASVQDETRAVDIEQAADIVIRAQVPGLGNVVATNVLAGSSNTPGLRFTITGLNLTTNTPAVVMIQPRQGDNQDSGFPDEFVVQVISTTSSSILCRILRIDTNSGWGQNLRLDMFIVDSVVNP
jgi:hypothetical protein